MALTPFGSTAILPKVASAAGQFRLPTGREHGLGVREHRVAAVGEPGGARVVGLAAEVEPPASVRPDGGGDADRVAGEVEGAALLDVEFDERADTGQPFGVRADGVGVVPGRFHGLRQGDAVTVAQAVRGLDGQLPGGEPGADTGETEARALLVTEVGDGQRPGELHSPAAEFIERGKGGDDAERPVEGSAVRYGVEVRAGDDGVPGQGVAAPGPLVAVAVHLAVEAAGLGLHPEPEAAVGVGPGPGVAPVAAGLGVAADVPQGRPHRVEGGAHAAVPSVPAAASGPPSRIGTLTPRSAATDSAMS